MIEPVLIIFQQQKKKETHRSFIFGDLLVFPIQLATVKWSLAKNE